MTIHGWLSLVVALIGAVVYLLVKNPKASEMGRLAYFAGVLAWLFANGTKVVNLL